MYLRVILGTDQNHRIVENGESPVRQHSMLIIQSLNGDCLKGNAVERGYGSMRKVFLNIPQGNRAAIVVKKGTLNRQG